METDCSNAHDPGPAVRTHAHSHAPPRVARCRLLPDFAALNSAPPGRDQGLPWPRTAATPPAQPKHTFRSYIAPRKYQEPLKGSLCRSLVNDYLSGCLISPNLPQAHPQRASGRLSQVGDGGGAQGASEPQRTVTKSLCRGPHLASKPFLSFSTPPGTPFLLRMSAPLGSSPSPKSLSDFPAPPLRLLSASILSPASSQRVPSPFSLGRPRFKAASLHHYIALTWY